MTNDLILVYAGFFICSIIISLLLNGLLLRFSLTMGVRANPELVRWSTSAKPAVGGISFYVMFLLSLACYAVFFPYRFVALDKQLLGVLGAVTIAFIMGLADDAYNTKPFLKLFVQIFCGVILIATDQSIQIFDNVALNNTLTILWVVGIMNSINMLDNMDAITATVSLFILFEALLILYIGRDFSSFNVIMLLGVVGSLSGFLFFNWHPSKLFMGDTGSQFLGILLAIIGVRYFWNNPDFGGHKYESKQIIVTLLAFLVPFCDTTIVVIKRIMKGRAPWLGGKDHTTHHLSYLGLSDSQIALAFAAISVISMMMILVIQGTIMNWNLLHILLFSGYIAAVFGTLFTISLVTKRPAKNDESPG
ncbi:MAG TPA: MraY family glycosyltransferase [Bacteroidia bacterium]|nr:MraY family glycosyltransferase [Bacteroidia bacterium]